MKKTTIWISPEGVPMHSVNGWPKHPQIVLTHYSWFYDDYLKALAKAKAEAIPFEDPDFLWNYFKRRSLGSNTFIEIEGEVYSVKQYWSTSGVWVDTDFIDPYMSAQYQTRSVARLKPAENKLCEHCGAKEDQDCQHGGGSCPWADDAASEDYMKPAESVVRTALPMIDLNTDPWYNDKCRPVARVVPEKIENSAMGYTEGADVPEDPDQRLFNFLASNGFVTLDDDRHQIKDIVLGEYNEKLSAEQKHNDKLVKQLDAANQTINELKRAIIAGTNLYYGIGWDGDKPEIEKVKEQLAAAQARVKELEDLIADLHEEKDPKEVKRKIYEALTE